MDPRLIEALTARAVEELTAVAQYTARMQIFQHLRYPKLVAYTKERRDDEQGHLELLMTRLQQLGAPLVVPRINQVMIGQEIPDMFAFDLQAEVDAINAYNFTIALAVELGDDETRRVLETILADEVEHQEDLLGDVTQIQVLTLANYLSAKI